MKKIALVVISLIFFNGLHAQHYWQQQTDYTIHVALADSIKSLDGFEKIIYTNNSPDTLSFIWFHVWPNAYKNDRTNFSEQMLENGSTRFYFSNKEERGYINRLDFKVNNAGAKTEDHPEYIDVIKLVLPQKLAPGNQVTITTPFHVKLPFNFSRGGYDGKTFQLTQWYPKPAVYDRKGWHVMPYLDQGEFYSEFGSFDVSISAHPDFLIAATGNLEHAKDGYLHEDFRNIHKIDSSTGKPITSITWRYKQDHVHDFAWFASKNFIVDTATVLLPSGKQVFISVYYHHVYKNQWQHAVKYAADALKFYSKEVGEYPFDVLKVVQGPASFGGGMEYPTITVISPTADDKELDATIAHEIGHNWFYGILATNERDHPWMDEGINSYFEAKYVSSRYGQQKQGEEILFQTLAKMKKDQPIETSSAAFTSDNYGMVAYYKTRKWMELLEQTMGKDSFSLFIHEYYNRWKFMHPQPEDFHELLNEYMPQRANEFRTLQLNKGLLPGEKLKGFRFLTPFNPRSIKEYFRHPSSNTLLVSPAIGYNVYDGFQAGLLFTNYKLPPSSFQFAAVPLYGTRSQSLNGIARASYTSYLTKPFSKIEWTVTGSTFSNAKFEGENGKEYLSRFVKIAPSLQLWLSEKDSRSERQKSVQFKSFFIAEQPFRIKYDSVFSPSDTVVTQRVAKADLNYAIHQLKFEVHNFRVLYPYEANVTIQGSENFIRLAFETNYFFNYKKGGLALRVFAGKLFYNETKEYPYGYYINRFGFNLTGANGYEDYTYSNYFVGRNEFEGLESRQIVVRDGGFKVRTDLLSDKIGQTNDWLAAINLNTNLPDKINPLSMLPLKIPVHLFMDIGTYAEAWKEENESGRFLYDAGIHVPVFGGVVNFYFPVVYSKPFSDYVKSSYEKQRFIKNMSFTVDLKKLTYEARKKLLL